MAMDVSLARLTVALSRVVYRSEERARGDGAALGLSDFRFFADEPNEALSATGDDRLFLAFRGTEAKVIDWIQNARFKPIPGELNGRVHSGFRTGLDGLWGDITPVVEAAGLPVVLTGHSLGGALATLAAARLHEAGHEVAAVYTYGQPRIGLSDFRGPYRAGLDEVTYRFINHIDLVTRVPLLVQGYRNVGHRVYFDRSGRSHVDAGIWKVALDDVLFRLTHFGRLEAAGLDPHDKGTYVDLVEAMAG